MIGRLRGLLVDREPGRGILDVHGVGYLVHATERSLDRWQAEDEVIVHVSTQVREDAFNLYGFPTKLDQQVFDVLIGVKGVGPKVALAIQDSLDPTQLVTAVESDDLVSLCKPSGVGKRLAQRLALELKGKLPVAFEPIAASQSAAPVKDDLLVPALSQLGYNRSEIKRAIAALESQGVDPTASVSSRLKLALAALSGR